MKNLACNILIILVIVLLIGGFVFFLRNKRAVKNNGTINDLITDDDTKNMLNNVVSSSPSNINTNIMPADVFSDNTSKWSNYMSEDGANNDLSNSENDFLYKKKKFTRRTPADIEDQFDIEKMLPQEHDKDWWDPMPLDHTTRVSGDNHICSKSDIGLNTIGTTRKNKSLDMRGDAGVQNPVGNTGPFMTSTIEPDQYARGLCI